MHAGDPSQAWRAGDEFYRAYMSVIRLLASKTPLSTEECLERLMAAFCRDNKLAVARNANGEAEYSPEALATVWPYFESLVDPEKGLAEKVSELTQWAESKGDEAVLGELARLFGH